MLLGNRLRLERFCGHEVYPVETAEVFVSLPDEDQKGVVLNLEFRCGKVVECTTPEAERGRVRPAVEVNLPLPTLVPDELVGTTLRVAASLDEARGTWNRIYVFAHEDLREIAASFVELSETECRLSLTGRTRDPNHYDGSKPETRVVLDAWFPVAKLSEARSGSA